MLLFPNHVIISSRSEHVKFILLLISGVTFGNISLSLSFLIYKYLYWLPQRAINYENQMGHMCESTLRNIIHCPQFTDKGIHRNILWLIRLIWLLSFYLDYMWKLFKNYIRIKPLRCFSRVYVCSRETYAWWDISRHAEWHSEKKISQYLTGPQT